MSSRPAWSRGQLQAIGPHNEILFQKTTASYNGEDEVAETKVAGYLPAKLFWRLLISCFLGSLCPIIQAEPL